MKNVTLMSGYRHPSYDLFVVVNTETNIALEGSSNTRNAERAASILNQHEVANGRGSVYQVFPAADLNFIK